MKKTTILWIQIQSADVSWIDSHPEEYDRMIRKIKALWKRFPHLKPF